MFSSIMSFITNFNHLHIYSESFLFTLSVFSHFFLSLTFYLFIYFLSKYLLRVSCDKPLCKVDEAKTHRIKCSIPSYFFIFSIFSVYYSNLCCSPCQFYYLLLEVLWFKWASLLAQLVKNLPAMRETWVQYLGWEDPLEKEWLPTLVFWPGELGCRV